MKRLKLGLIGGEIAASQSPRLHRLAGDLCGLEVSYDLLMPARLGLSFDAVFDRCRRNGYDGVNITYPYKEQALERLDQVDAAAREIGACNTVVFRDGAARGANTDFSGFIAAFRDRFGDASPGRVAMAGAGGVGKAIGFALRRLGAASLSVFDPDRKKAAALCRALAAAGTPAAPAASIEEASAGADGLVNSTPLGMNGVGGAFPPSTLAGPQWAFDAVYTPVNTPFVIAAKAAGLAVISGYELFLHQGVDAFRIFAGLSVDERALRMRLQEEAAPVGSRA